MISAIVTAIIILLILSGLFSAMETAYTSLTPGQTGVLAENYGKRGRLVKQLTERPDILLTTLLIGNNLANIGASSLTTILTIKLFGNAYVAAATGLLTLTVLIFCEVSPKQIALSSNEKIALGGARTILLLSWIFRPFIWIISSISKIITRIFTGKEKQTITLESLLHQVKAARGQGVVETYEEEMVRNVFRINDTPIEAIMTHRTELFTLEDKLTTETALEKLTESGFSKAPVLTENEEITGVITLADLVKAVKTAPGTPVRKFSSPPYIVPGTLKVHELFFRFKNEAIHLAVVLDEYGGLDGIVTREDVIEEIFGDFYDERNNSVDKPPITKEKDGSWIIQGNANFYNISDTLKLKLPHDSRTHTVGGYLMEQLEEIPEPGTIVKLPEGEYTILEIKDKRIISVRFTPSDTAPE